MREIGELPAIYTNEEKNSKKEELDDYVDIKAKYRRLKIEDQCRKLNRNVKLPSRMSWRDKIYGNDDPKIPEQANSSANKLSPKVQRKISWEQRTKIYYVDKSIDIQNIKIIDTIHIKRRQIEAKIEECKERRAEKKDCQTRLMLTYPGYEKGLLSKIIKEIKQEEIKIDIPDIDLKSLSLKNNTSIKMSILKELTRKSSFEKAKKVETPPTRKKNYSASMDWREELKNKEKAKEKELLAGFTLGMPEYKEPETKIEEVDISIQEKKLETTEEKWQKVKLRPPRQAESKSIEENKEADPFRITLRPVGKRNKDKYCSQSSGTREPDLYSKGSEKVKIITSKNELLQDNVSVDEIKDNLLKNKDIKKEEKDILINKKSGTKDISKKAISENKETTKNITMDLVNVNNSKNTYSHKNEAQKYVTKIINFVAIKIAVDDVPVTTKRKRPKRKKSDEKPPCPVERAPSLPKDALLEHLYEFIVEEKEEEAHTLENDTSAQEVEIISHVDKIKEKALVTECPKIKEKKSHDEIFNTPRRRKLIDYVPEPFPKRMNRRDSDVEPVKFSSVADNYVTKYLFVGSQYVGAGGQQSKQ